MFQFYTAFLLILYLSLSITIDSNSSPSKSIDNSNSIHRLAIPKRETDRSGKSNNTNHHNELPKRKSHQETLNEHLKIIIIISSISVGLMTIIVSAYIAIQYLRNRGRNSPETTEQTIPLKTSKRKNKMGSITTA